MLFSITPSALAHEMRKAKHRIYYAGAGIDATICEAITAVMAERNDIEVIVAADCSAHARRLGYGDHKSFMPLMERGVTIHQLANIRLSTCVVDDRAWAFTIPPRLVEDPENQIGLNGIEVHRRQAKEIAQQMAVFSNGSLHTDEPPQETGNTLIPIQLSSAKPLTNRHLADVERDLERNPPQQFDVSRQVNVFNSRIEFVELELEGGHLDRHTFKFPKEFKQLLSNDPAAQERLSASYKLISANSKASSKPIVEQVERLRSTFLKPMGKKGRVILRAQKENFEKCLAETKDLIERYKTSLHQELAKEIERSKKNLIQALADRVKANPPTELKHGIEGKRVTKADAQRFLGNMLERYMPEPKQLMSDIQLHCTFKAVTYEMLSDPEFQAQLKQQFPYVEWDSPLEEYTAAKAAEQTELPLA